MIAAFTWLLLFQLAGEITAQVLGLPLPGPVLGMAFLFCALVWRGSVPLALDHASGMILRNLALLFIPAGVGVMVHIARLRDEWLAIAVSLVVSTLGAIILTAWVLDRLLRAKAKRDAA
ncbi:MAG: hypothetical protein RIR70_2124 [Pseudomonadota bacterium]